MTQKSKQIWWWIFTFSFVLIWFLWLILTLIFRIISTSWAAWDFYTIKSFINWILWLLALLSFIPWLPLWIVFLVKGYRNQEYNRHIKLETDSLGLRDIYQEDFDASNLSKTDIQKVIGHCITKKFSPGLAVFLNIITVWIFWFFYYWFRHDDFPIIKSNDFGSWKAIWFMFIPFFNIYWQFVFWLKLVNRINLQYRLMRKEIPISKWFAITTLILSIIPYVNYVWFLIFHSILIYQIQLAINGLVKTK